MKKNDSPVLPEFCELFLTLYRRGNKNSHSANIFSSTCEESHMINCDWTYVLCLVGCVLPH